MSHPRYHDLEHLLATQGSFGATELVARSTDGKYFVKNVIHLQKMAQPLTRADLYQFGSIVKIQHPNLARVREALIVGSSKTDTEDKMVIISDFIEGGMSLRNSMEIKMKREQDFRNDEILRIFVQVLLGLKALHDVGLTHGNLKPSNIFLEGPLLSKVNNKGNNNNNIDDVSTSPTANGRTIIKLVGFSFYSFFVSARENVHLPFYAAPEICADVGNKEILHDASKKKQKLTALTTKSDIWSVGCIIHELLTFRKPFDSDRYQYLCDQIKSSPFIDDDMLHEKGANDALIELIHLMLHKDPSKRPTVDSMLALPFLQQHLHILMNANSGSGDASIATTRRKKEQKNNNSKKQQRGFSHETYKNDYLQTNVSPPQNIQTKNFDNYTKSKKSNNYDDDNNNTHAKDSIEEDEISKLIRVGSPSLTTLGVTDESIRMALEEEKLSAFKPKKWAVQRSPTNQSSSTPPVKQLKQQQQNAVTYRKNNAMRIRTNFNQHVKINKKKNVAVVGNVRQTDGGGEAKKTRKVGSPLSPKTLAVAAASSKRRNNNNNRKISDSRYNDNYNKDNYNRNNVAANNSPNERFSFSHSQNTNIITTNTSNNSTNNKAAKMLQRRNSEKIEKQKEYEAMLAEARKQAFKERKQLEKKMQGFNNPVTSQHDATVTNGTNGDRNNVAFDYGYAGNAKNQQGIKSYIPSPTRETQSNRLQRRRRSLDNVNRKFNSKQSMEENEDAYKEALAKARIEAFEERKALERKMKGVGGRPTAVNGPSSPSTPTKIPSFDRRHLQRKPSIEEIRMDKNKKKMAEEKAYKEALAKARIETFNERKALEQRHRAAQGRPAVAHQSDALNIVKEIRKSTPFAIDMSQEEFEHDVTKIKAETERRRRINQKTKNAERELYEKQLENARIAAFEERIRLKNKYGRGGGV